MGLVSHMENDLERSEQDGLILDLRRPAPWVQPKTLSGLARIAFEKGETAMPQPNRHAVLKGIAYYLHLEVIDKTMQGGCLWIVAGIEIANVLLAMGMTFAPSGGHASRGKAAWWIA